MRPVRKIFDALENHAEGMCMHAVLYPTGLMHHSCYHYVTINHRCGGFIIKYAYQLLP